MGLTPWIFSYHFLRRLACLARTGQILGYDAEVVHVSVHEILRFEGAVRDDVMIDLDPTAARGHATLDRVAGDR